METRNSVQIPFLEDAPLDKIKGSQLPKNIELFQHFWFHYKILGKKINNALCDTTKSAVAYWQSVGLKLKKIDYVISDLSRLFDKHKVKFCFCFNDTSFYFFMSFGLQ